jgi:hypothetical protein
MLSLLEIVYGVARLMVQTLSVRSVELLDIAVTQK